MPVPSTLYAFPAFSSSAFFSLSRFSCSMMPLLQLQHKISTVSPRRVRFGTYYRLGKNRSGAGYLGRSSNSALMDHTTPIMPKITAPQIAVFLFQFLGCAYQPPDGDQTCLGYLRDG